MNTAAPTSPPHYLTVIHNVQEVTLFGTADLAFWRDHLAQEKLFPYNNNGYADVIISATNLKWMGKRFHELSISLYACTQPDACERNAIYLVHSISLNIWREKGERDMNNRGGT